MSRLTREDRARLLQMLCEGMSIRGASRATGASKNTIIKLLVDAGQASAAYQDRVLRNLPCKRVQVDEIWSFIHTRSQNLRAAMTQQPDAGDVWTWTALCADTKLMCSFFVGDRTTASSMPFIDDLQELLANGVQLTSDGHRSYVEAVDVHFGEDVDYAMLVKLYGQPEPSATRAYAAPLCIGAKKTKINGNPDTKHISTSFVERHNLSMRMRIRHFGRLTNAHSKKIENHACAVALHCMYYNFVKLHQTLKTTPAMAAGVTSRLWEMADLVEMLEAWEEL
jgi:IS1 family transposase